MNSTTLSRIFETLKATRHKRNAETADRYLTLVRSLANGEEIDTVFAGEVLEEFGITEAELGRDVDIQEKRYQAAKDMAEFQKLSEGLPKLEQALNDARAEYHRETAKLNAKIDKAKNAYDTMLNKTFVLNNAQYYLRDNVLDQSLLARGKELQRELLALFDAHRDDLDDYENAKEALAKHQRHVDELTQSIRKSPGHSHERIQKALVREQAFVKKYQGMIDDLSPKIEAYHSQNDLLGSQWRAVLTEQMIP